MLRRAESPFERDENIAVKLGKFGVPSSIDTDDISVAFTGDNAATGNPSDVEIDGTTVTLVAPFIVSSGEDEGDEISADSGGTGATITLKRGADITLPIRHDDYDIEVTDDAGDADDGVQNWVTVRREVSVKPKDGKRGTEVTVSGKGFTDGSADLFLGSVDDQAELSIFSTIDPINVADGAFEVKVDTSVKVNKKSVFTGSDPRETFINISDAKGDSAEKAAKFTIKPSISVSPDNPKPGQDMTITLNDIEPATSGTGDDEVVDEAPTISFAGAIAKDLEDDEDDKFTTWKIQVPGTVRVGTIQVRVNVDDEPALTANITIGTNDLTVSPTTVVPRQTISIDGSGFKKRGNVDHYNVIIDGERVNTTEDEETELINNNGDVSFDVIVPDGVNAGTNRRVEVTDSGNRVGTATITIAEAEITVSPEESLRGGTVTVSGTGFPANDLVLIKYNGSTIDTASTTPTGTFVQDITVPSSEGINPGQSYTVEAVSQVNTPDVSDDIKHKILGAEITLSPDTTSPGSNITISGQELQGTPPGHFDSDRRSGCNAGPCPANRRVGQLHGRKHPGAAAQPDPPRRKGSCWRRGER